MNRESLREAAKEIGYGLFRALGTYAPYRRAEKEARVAEAVSYLGDVPAGSVGDERGNLRRRFEYEVPRPLSVRECNVLYTPRGMAWQGRCLRRCLSAHEPSFTKDLLRRPRAERSIPTGTIVEAEYPNTYGDWVLEHVAPLALHPHLESPLLLPQRMMERSYVRRDLATLGIEAVAVTEPVEIGQALVLRKHLYGHHWTKEAAEACRRAYRSEDVSPRPETVLYLCRQGETAASVGRSYPHEVILDVMRDLGVKVVYAKETTMDDFRRLALGAETVIADHGSALCNLLLWRTKNVIELFSNEWWNGYFVFLAKAAGVEHHGLIDIDGIDRATLRTKIEQLLSLMV